MKSDRLLFSSKIGITKKPFSRQSQVDVSTRGNVVIVVCFKFMFYKSVERFLHSLFALFRRRKIKGSGGTEWFYLPPFVTALTLTTVWVLSVFIYILIIYVFLLILMID